MIRCRALFPGILMMMCTPAGMSATQPATPEDSVTTTFSVLVGYPAKDRASGSGALLVPGTLIPLTGEAGAQGDTARRQVVEKSLSFSSAVEKLWSMFRLDPAVQQQEGKTESAIIGKPIDLPALDNANVRLTATMLRFDNGSATYRVVFKQGDKTLADSTAIVARGGRAVVGGLDGAAAPYIFVFIEPEAAGKEPAGSRASPRADGFTEPKPIATVQPIYPEEAKKEKVQGVVVLKLLIDADGRVEDVTVLEDPDPRLTKAAIESVRQWKFSPALDRKGNPVSVHSAVTIRFKLM